LIEGFREQALADRLNERTAMSEAHPLRFAFAEQRLEHALVEERHHVVGADAALGSTSTSLWT